MTASESEAYKLLTGSTFKDGPQVLAGILFFEGSTPDTSNLRQGISRLDQIAGIPFIDLMFEATKPSELPIVNATVFLQHKAIGGEVLTDGRIPLVLKPQRKINFSISQDNILNIYSKDGKIGLFNDCGFPIESRLKWFLEKSNTLSIRVTNLTTEEVWCTTAFREDEEIPMILRHPGSISQKNFDALVNSSTSWMASTLGNPSLFADSKDLADDHYDIYASFKNGGSILPAKLNHIGTCLACDNPADSNEHCTPNWVATDQGVKPVTSILFCKECNNFFGEHLENPIATSYKSGNLHNFIDNELDNHFPLWAIKTALTLTSASGGRIDRRWMQEIRNLNIPSGFEIYVLCGIPMKDPGYLYGVTFFSADRHSDDYFLFSFCTSNLIFIVVRTEIKMGSFGFFPRVHPSYLKPATPITEELDLSKIHDDYLSNITGLPIEFTERSNFKGQNRN